MNRIFVTLLVGLRGLARVGARFAWRIRVQMHATDLRLTPEQRAGLIRLLLGSRPLRSFTAAELRVQSDWVEEFSSAAAVQAALDAAGGQVGNPEPVP